MARTSSRVTWHKLISENTTGHFPRAAADRILSEHTAPSSGPVPASRGTRPSNAPLTKSVEIPLTGPEAKAPVQKLLPGVPGFRFLDTGVIFCSTYCVFERARWARGTFYGEQLYKMQNSRSASEILSSTKRSYAGSFFGQEFPGCHKAAPRACPPTDCGRYEIQGRTKYVVDMSSGAAANKLISENTTRHIQQAADHMILSEHTAPSSGPKSVGRSTRPSNVFSYWVRSETSPRGKTMHPLFGHLPHLL